jgi:hypothetical protein
MTVIAWGKQTIVYRRNHQCWLKQTDFILWDAAVLQISCILAYYIRFEVGRTGDIRYHRADMTQHGTIKGNCFRR